MNNVVLLIIHLLFSVSYTFISYKHNKQQAIYKFMIVFFIPIAGAAFLFTLKIFKVFLKEENMSLRLHEDGIAIDSSDFIRDVDFSKEVNVIPIEEAFAINSDSIKRKTVVDLFKEDAIFYIDFLEKALNDSDTETSHYAAAAVLEIQRKLTLSLQDMSVKYQKDKGNVDILVSYSEILKNYLASKLLDDKSRKKYSYLYSNLLGELLEIRDSEEYYKEKIECDIKLKEYDRARQCCESFLSKYSSVEAPYLMLLKYYYIMEDKKNFYNTIDLFKKSPAKFSNEALKIVRFWSEGVTDEKH